MKKIIIYICIILYAISILGSAYIRLLPLPESIEMSVEDAWEYTAYQKNRILYQFIGRNHLATSSGDGDSQKIMRLSLWQKLRIVQLSEKLTGISDRMHERGMVPDGRIIVNTDNKDAVVAKQEHYTEIIYYINKWHIAEKFYIPNESRNVYCSMANKDLTKFALLLTRSNFPRIGTWTPFHKWFLRFGGVVRLARNKEDLVLQRG